MTDGSEPSRDEGPGDRAREALLLRTWSDGEAAVVRQLLEQYGIPCRIVSDITHAVLPLSVDGLGEVRVLVRESRRDEAVAILADHRRHAMTIVPGSRDDAGEDGESGE